MYPAGYHARQISFDPLVSLPAGWQFSTQLDVASQSGSTVRFKPVSLEMLLDSPLFAGRHFRRYELGSLFTEGKILEAVAKLRELVAQGRREDPKMPVDMHYGRFLFPLADEVRQMIGIHSWARVNNVNLKQSMNYNRFKDTIADRLGDYMKNHALVRQRPHPFPLLKKWEAARTYSEADLFRALSQLADLEIKRKSGGLPVDVGIETFLLQRLRA